MRSDPPSDFLMLAGTILAIVGSIAPICLVCQKVWGRLSSDRDKGGEEG